MQKTGRALTGVSSSISRLKIWLIPKIYVMRSFNPAKQGSEAVVNFNWNDVCDHTGRIVHEFVAHGK